MAHKQKVNQHFDIP